MSRGMSPRLGLIFIQTTNNKPKMKTSDSNCRLFLCIFLIAFVCSFRITALTVENPRSDGDIKDEIVALEKHITYRQERLAELVNDMLALDQRSEKRIGQILDALTKSTDSQESKSNVAITKQQAIEALKTCSEHYKSRRKSLKMEVMQRSPRITREELFKDIGRFDNRIDNRLEQVIAITNSMQLHQDYEKYRGYEGYNLWRNDRYYQNRKEVVRTEKEREQLLEEIRSDIEAVERRTREIRRILESKVTPQYRVMLMDELEVNYEKIEKRQEHISKLAFPKKPQTTPVGRAQAINIGTVVGNMATDLDRDCRAIWRTYAEINRERESLKQLRERLAVNLGELETRQAKPTKKKG